MYFYGLKHFGVMTEFAFGGIFGLIEHQARMSAATRLLVNYVISDSGIRGFPLSDRGLSEAYNYAIEETNPTWWTTRIQIETNWALNLAWLPASGLDVPIEYQDDLKRDFNQRLKLNNGKCKEAVNKLLDRLGKKFKSKDGELTGIEALAERFFGDRKYKILSSPRPSSSGDALGSYDNRVIKLLDEGGQFFFGANAKLPTTAGSSVIYNIGDTFLHELIHAEGGRTGIAHKRIMSAIFELEGLKDFNQYLADAENEAMNKGLKGEKKAAFLDQKFARDFGYWQGNCCNYEGGMDAWKAFSQNHR